MKPVPMTDELRARVRDALSQSPLFGGLNADGLSQVLGLATLFQFDPEESVTKQGQPSDSFFLVLRGEGRVLVQNDSGLVVEISRVSPPMTIGEVGLLLNEPRTATVVADANLIVLKFDAPTFHRMLEVVPNFGRVLTLGLARRLQHLSTVMPPQESGDRYRPTPETLGILPLQFLQRHRVIPLELSGNALTLGFVDDPSSAVVSAVRQQVPGMEIRPVRISVKLLDQVLSSRAGVTEIEEPKAAPEVSVPLPKLDPLLKRVVAEGASDLHLGAMQKPRWRIDGELTEIADVPALGPKDARDMLAPAMAARHNEDLDRHADADFVYALGTQARFRINIYQDRRGVSAAIRQIPTRILNLEQLALPPVVRSFCLLPKGMVLVTGATGSGKSTTLAAMIDYINKTRRTHVITLEDPIEFVHESAQSMVHQREVGIGEGGYPRMLRAALREDPDVILIGELRDKESISLSVEAANTGHLVFSTLHTSSAVATIDRMIDTFPPDQQGQIRSGLADMLKGVICQTLCKRKTGGRIAALEILVVTTAVSNLIREGKAHLIPSTMQTSKKEGNLLMNESLAALVKSGTVAPDEAFESTTDRSDLQKRLGLARE